MKDLSEVISKQPEAAVFFFAYAVVVIGAVYHMISSSIKNYIKNERKRIKCNR